MRKCLKIRVFGNVQGVAYRAYTQKQAQQLSIEGSVQNAEDGTVIIFACGNSEHLDKFIDMLYKGTAQSKVQDVAAEPLMNEKDFRGAFRIIGD
jgi:acylphosphatase